MSNWIFFHISHNGISQWNLVCFHSKLSVFYKNSRLVFKSRCEIESFVTYLTMESCLLFHSKLRFLYKNSSLVFKSRCQIDYFVTYLTMESCLLFHSKLWFFIRIQVLFSNLDVRIFFHIYHSGILFAISFKAMNIW